MKKALLFFSILFLSLELKGQTEEYFDPDDRPKFYFGVGTGINTYTGLAGLSGNFIIEKKLFVQAGLGLSSWGVRTSIGLRYDRSYRNGFTYGIGLSNSSGIDDIDMELETASGGTRDINMQLENAPAIYIKTGYNWWFGENNTFNINLGYSVALKGQPWTVNDGSSLSPTSQQVLQLIAPGGIILGMGFTFGIQ
ncbi:hypothetical protein [Marivirga sp.]|uniref:hypothetical protein n=1 Tax=Marivirga sp. TaxID=2018662 RepID=UPI0025FB9069|nr:hypothetical protein [Marivirga sp.]